MIGKSFSNIFLEPGDKVLVVHRRIFEKDRGRFFLGQVGAFNENTGLLKVTGYSFSPDLIHPGRLNRKQELRTKILSLTSGSLIVYQLPQDTHVETTNMITDGNQVVSLVDGDRILMDLSE